MNYLLINPITNIPFALLLSENDKSCVSRYGHNKVDKWMDWLVRHVCKLLLSR